MPDFLSSVEEKAPIIKTPNALRTIGEAAKILEVPQHVLRFWEGKFTNIIPIKRRNRRYYRPQDIETLQIIKSLLYKEGYTIKGVQRYFAQEEEKFKPLSSEMLPLQKEKITLFVRTNSHDLDALEHLLTRLEYIQKSLLAITKE